LLSGSKSSELAPISSTHKVTRFSRLLVGGREFSDRNLVGKILVRQSQFSIWLELANSNDAEVGEMG